MTITQLCEEREAYARQQTENVLREEASAIFGVLPDTLSQKHGSALYRELNKLNSAALCLSGGGIRSAAFCLGVIQALASFPRSAAPNGDGCRFSGVDAGNSLLSKFHYLSTVSGGGYIGGWLSAWRSQSPFWDAQRPQDSIWTCLVSRPLGPDHEPQALGWLRAYSNYLTPSRGVLSADSWAAVALFMRNLVLNWLVILPIFCVVVLLLKLTSISSDWLTRLPSSMLVRWGPLAIDRSHIQAVFAIAGLICQIVALAFVCRNRPTRRPEGDSGPSQPEVIIGSIVPTFLSALFLAQFLASDFVGHLLDPDENLKPDYSLPIVVIIGAVCGAVVYASSWIAARARWDLQDFLLWMAAGALYGCLMAFGLYWYIQIPESGIWIFSSVVLHLVFGIPWIILSQMIAEIVFLGLSSYQPNSDADREWFGRAGGWMIVAAIAWCVLTFAVFFGAVLAPQFVPDEVQDKIKELSATLAALFGAATAILGRSGSTPIRGSTGNWSSRFVNISLSIVAPLFVIALLIAISYLLDQLVLGQTLVPDLFVDWAESESGGPESKLASSGLDRFQAIIWLAAGVVAFSAIAVVASRCVNINRFSLHAMYRNRIIRAFLGASRRRKPDSFTGFDSQDNPRVYELWSAPEPQNWRPFHIINMALNVVSSDRLSWQERKAEPFTATPLHCGSSYLGYRDARTYGDPNGISLGTAIAISGAAASPNMGYHSSPAITFLMTMFNVRLGWWLGNPGASGADTFDKDGPGWAFKPIIAEAFGLTNDRQGYVYLSDGGHFDNLGLYEAVRRRCRFIMVVDAGCDPEFALEDLGNAVRKIQIDHGVPIRLFGLQNLLKRPMTEMRRLMEQLKLTVNATVDGGVVASGQCYAMGEIDYGAADGGKHPSDSRNGFILYLKPGYLGSESAGVRSYASKFQRFPHESTLNQWFTESQFESYRSLGFEIVSGVINKAISENEGSAHSDLEGLFCALMKQAKRAAAVQPVSAENAVSLSRNNALTERQ
jgi:hypothetical protein